MSHANNQETQLSIVIAGPEISCNQGSRTTETLKVQTGSDLETTGYRRLFKFLRRAFSQRILVEFKVRVYRLRHHVILKPTGCTVTEAARLPEFNLGSVAKTTPSYPKGCLG